MDEGQQDWSDTPKVGIGAMVIMTLVVIIGVLTTLWLSDDSSDEPESTTIEAIESPETAPESPPQTEATTSSEFERFMPEITRIVIAPNDVTVYVWCDGSTRVYVMNTASSTKQMQVVRDFAGCPNEHIAGEVIHG